MATLIIVVAVVATAVVVAVFIRELVKFLSDVDRWMP
jgi:hypothetical protein